MKKDGRDNRPAEQPSLREGMSTRNVIIRVILLAGFLALATFAIGTGLHEMLSTQATWQTVEATGIETSWAADFTFLYDFSAVEGDPGAHRRVLGNLYSEASRTGYRLFSPEVREEGFYNVGYLNAHPNEEVSVEPGLFPALELVSIAEDRHVFTAPAEREYEGLLSSGDDAQAAYVDPRKNPETLAWLKELSRFQQDPAHVRLDVTGEGKIRLTVSQEYLKFAEDYGLDTLFDFGIFQNAFLVDYLAEEISARGYRAGYLCSFDGFTRNLDDRGVAYEQNLFHRQGREICMPAKISYTGPKSIVVFRDYPLSGKDQWHYYVYENGETVSLYLDPADGLCKSTLPELTAYSGDLSCGELVVKLADLYISDTFQQEKLAKKMDGQMDVLWFSGSDLCYTGNPPELLDADSGYALKKVK